MSQPEEKKAYVIVKIPVELAEEIDRTVERCSYKDRTEFAKEAIRLLLRDINIRSKV